MIIDFQWYFYGDYQYQGTRHTYEGYINHIIFVRLRMSDSDQGEGYYSDDDSDIEQRDSFLSAHSNNNVGGSIVGEPI